VNVRSIHAELARIWFDIPGVLAPAVIKFEVNIPVPESVGIFLLTKVVKIAKDACAYARDCDQQVTIVMIVSSFATE
jgi:hypothetical protein